MSGKYESMRKEIPIHGREGIVKLGALLEQDFFDWDSFSVRYCLVDGTGMIPEETPKQHTHDYDQVLWFLSADPSDMLHLGAEVEPTWGKKASATASPPPTPSPSPRARPTSPPS